MSSYYSLIDYIYDDDIESLEELINSKTKLNDINDRTGNTLLHMAVKLN